MNDIKEKKREFKKRRKLEKKAKRNHNRINKGWILLLGICLLLAGTIVMFISFVIPDEGIWAILKQILSTLGQVVVSIAATAILFEHFGYVDYAVKRLCEVFTKDEVIKTLSTDKKKQFKNKLMTDLYLQDSGEESSELIALVEDEMNKILSDYYYTEYITYVDFFIEDINGIKVFHKKIRRTFSARPVQSDKECCLDNILFLRTHSITGIESNILINMLKINDKIVDSGSYEFECVEIERDADCYDIEYRLKINDSELIKFNKECNVDILYETFAEYSDKTYAITIDRPCKHFCCHFNLNMEEYDITIKSNGFMCYGVENVNRKREIQTYNGKMLRFLTWILPGDGVVSMISEK